MFSVARDILAKNINVRDIIIPNIRRIPIPAFFSVIVYIWFARIRTTRLHSTTYRRISFLLDRRTCIHRSYSCTFLRGDRMVRRNVFQRLRGAREWIFNWCREHKYEYRLDSNSRAASGNLSDGESHGFRDGHEKILVTFHVFKKAEIFLYKRTEWKLYYWKRKKECVERYIKNLFIYF